MPKNVGRGVEQEGFVMCACRKKALRDCRAEAYSTEDPIIPLASSLLWESQGVHRDVCESWNSVGLSFTLIPSGPSCPLSPSSPGSPCGQK